MGAVVAAAEAVRLDHGRDELRRPSQRFIKALADGSDPVGDAIFRGQANATGGAYAPYFFDLRPDAEGWLLRYTLSTWNPYQVVLMQHRLTPADLVVTSHSV